MIKSPNKQIETFDNPAPQRDYTIVIKTDEFTCLCPLSGQPDFAKLKLEYTPEALCLELKSLKNFFWSFRDEQAFHEKITNDILETLCNTIKPRFMRLHSRFNVRGGLYTDIVVEHAAPNWSKS